MKRFVSVACLMMAGVLFADATPVMVSLVTPVQAPSYDYDVTGFRLSLIDGECQEFTELVSSTSLSRMAGRRCCRL